MHITDQSGLTNRLYIIFLDTTALTKPFAPQYDDLAAASLQGAGAAAGGGEQCCAAHVPPPGQGGLHSEELHRNPL